MGSADAKLAGHMYASPGIYALCGYRSFEVQAARARTGKVYLGGVLRF